ncbi:aromatic ring-hydroxylating dioxygenase subunit alpha [Massilia sp.]|uniref:aromatic ring-hydroxylating dioxygenase subunit alpha n=1 Tax=Massilia sp. TaxID=1882437 RepID=UPI0028AE0989|nr:aromatic ring-hydroxylating dioxygenase subunit alpha [Massilia sp.]
MFPLNQWYVAGFAWELTDQPLARTLLNHKVVLFRTGSGEVAALEDRCCHKSLPLSCGTVEDSGLRCGYHGLLFSPKGACLEVPGQERVPTKACVKSFTLVEQDQILWIWMPQEQGAAPTHAPPSYWVHKDPRYTFKGAVFHYDAPWQLIHDNLLDLSHLGYVHLKTIGGNAKVHMNAQLKVEASGDQVRVLRHMPDSAPPPTYTGAWPFKGNIDRWQEVEFNLSHLNIWTGGADVGAVDMHDPQRGGFHMRGFHAITPETDTTAHYMWTMASNRHPDKPDMSELVYEQTALTFYEDKVVIEAQYRNMLRFPGAPQVDIHVDVGPNRARRVIERLLKQQQQQPQQQPQQQSQQGRLQEQQCGAGVAPLAAVAAAAP